MIQFEKPFEESSRKWETGTLNLCSVRHLTTQNEQWETRRSFSGHHRLTVLLRGTVRYTVNRTDGVLRGMQVLCTAPGVRLSVRTETPGICEILLLEFDCDDRSLTPDTAPCFHCALSAETRNELLRTKLCTAPQRDALLLSALCELRKSRQPQSPHGPLIEKLNRYLAEHRTRPVTAEEAATAMGYSKDHLGRILRGCGLPPLKTLLCRERLCAAKEILTETDVSIRGIAEQLGFSSANDFHKFFRYHTGISPLKYRKNHLQPETPPPTQQPPPK